jgi:hypothetical protein
VFDHPFRTLGLLAGLLFTAGFAWAVTLGGYSLDDAEIEAESAWVRGFRQDRPDAARQIGLQCKTEIGRSAWTRDGAGAVPLHSREGGSQRLFL